jgi:hypothetical protein
MWFREGCARAELPWLLRSGRTFGLNAFPRTSAEPGRAVVIRWGWLLGSWADLVGGLAATGDCEGESNGWKMRINRILEKSRREGVRGGAWHRGSEGQ